MRLCVGATGNAMDSHLDCPIGFYNFRSTLLVCSGPYLPHSPPQPSTLDPICHPICQPQNNVMPWGPHGCGAEEGGFAGADFSGAHVSFQEPTTADEAAASCAQCPPCMRCTADGIKVRPGWWVPSTEDKLQIGSSQWDEWNEWWRDQGLPQLEGTTAHSIIAAYRCPDGRWACRGGNWNATADEQCVDGAMGALCSVCSADWTRYLFTMESHRGCASCEDSSAIGTRVSN